MSHHNDFCLMASNFVNEAFCNPTRKHGGDSCMYADALHVRHACKLVYQTEQKLVPEDKRVASR